MTPLKMYPRANCVLFLQALTGELSSFMCSAAHVNQMDRHPSTVGAFLEGMVKCKPQPHIRSCVLKVFA